MKFPQLLIVPAAALLVFGAHANELSDHSKMHGEASTQATPSHQATGVVKKIDAKAGTVTIAHGPIQSLGWPAMTMPFAVKDKGSLAAVKPGDKVKFDLAMQGDSAVITSMAVVK